ncbi:MAG: glycosyltransferase [Patescibacteria group bacterium]|nr:glycosyltransferase [Patescibacteria group bacterium]MDD4304273.1 glycosyltransferase [Patescibacteria group bacterium]MDD4695327.1 glycosyltransferase [Patescibacteria group bacterium]
MKIFVIGNDKNIFDKESKLFGRVVEYSQLVEKYTVVVPNNKTINLNVSEHLNIFSFGGKNKFFQIIKLFFSSIKIFKNEKFDVISVQDQYFLGFVAYLLSKMFRIGTEIQVHGFEKFYGIRKLLAKYVLKNANSIRVVSDRLKNQLIRDFGVLENKITIVPIYSDLKKIDTCLNDNSEFIFITISRLVKVKNIQMQIKAFKNVVNFFENNSQKKVKDLKLWIIGGGLLETKLISQVNNLNLDKKVEFFGWRNNLDDFYKKADVFLLTSNYEGWGIVIIEAANYGLPIIMTDVGCAGEFITNNENGIVIPIGDQKALEYKMIDLIENNDLRTKLSENVKKSISKLLTKEETFNLYKKSWEKAVL